jgi:LCP family protein required for cell wall assembly
VAAPILNPFPRWTREQSLNFLLLGIDRREENEVPRTDTLMLANLDLRARRASAVSIPRDLLVNIAGYGQDRINVVYGLGETQKRPGGGGMGLLRDTIERNFGVTVQHWALVDFGCFRGAVDALGGVTVTVPNRIYDPYYPTDDYRYQVVTFEPGRQKLDGERALQYARTRYGDTDFGRMRRQQQIVSAVREQALQVQSLGALPQVVRACSGLSSDLNVLDLVALGAAAREINQADIALRVIDEKLAVPYVAPSGASVLLPRWDEIRAMVRTSFPATTTASAAAR